MLMPGCLETGVDRYPLTQSSGHVSTGLLLVARGLASSTPSAATTTLADSRQSYSALSQGVYSMDTGILVL
jgi:hypothetical protein